MKKVRNYMKFADGVESVDQFRDGSFEEIGDV
jgi:hypothetical protein